MDNGLVSTHLVLLPSWACSCAYVYNPVGVRSQAAITYGMIPSNVDLLSCACRHSMYGIAQDLLSLACGCRATGVKLSSTFGQF